MKFHEMSWNVQFLTKFLDSGGSETLIFLRKNNDLCPGPPKDHLLAKFPQISWKSPTFPISIGNWPKSAEKVIFCHFHDFRSDHTPPGPMDLLVIAMVWGARACRGARKGAFSIFYKKIIKFHKKHRFSKNHEILWNFMKFMKFMEIIDFCESGGSKILIFLRKHWCFCNATNFMKFLFSTEKVEISWFPIFLHFPRISKKTHFFSKREPMAPRTTQNV